MNVTDPRPEASTTELLREAIAETRELVRLEVELAKDEVRGELNDAKRAAVMFGVAAVAALLAAAMLFVALSLAIFPGPVPALIIGAALVLTATATGLLALRRAPRKPLPLTQQRLRSDANALKGGLS